MRTLSSLSAVVVLIAVTSDVSADEKISIRGGLESASPADDASKKMGILGTLLVEGKKDKDTEFDKAMVKVTKGTKILRKVGTEFKEASFDDLRGGVKVEIIFDGPVGESYPVQANAKKIVITSR